jgi:hypothetical protein
VTQWSKGEYPGATNRQDDLAVMRMNGLPRVHDLHGSTVATATPLAPSLAGQAAAIDWTGDADVWSITVTARRAVYLAVDTAAAPGNPVDVNLNAVLWMWTGSVWWAVSNPVDDLDAFYTNTLNPGTYYFRVTGEGDGNLSTGYGNYGSIGRYRIAWI